MDNALSARGVLEMFEREKFRYLPVLHDKQGNVIRRPRKDSYSELVIRDKEFKEQILNVFGKGITKEDVGLIGSQVLCE